MSDPISLFIIAVGCLIGAIGSWWMTQRMRQLAEPDTDRLVLSLEQQWRAGLLSKAEAIQAAMRYDGFEAVELLHDDGHVERIELPPTALDQFYQLNDAVVSLTEAIQASFPSVHDIHGLFAGAAEIDRSAWVEDVTAAPAQWTLGDDGEIIEVIR